MVIVVSSEVPGPKLSMNCPDPKSLQALLDETLSADQQPLVEAHLGTCERC